MDKGIWPRTASINIKERTHQIEWIKEATNEEEKFQIKENLMIFNAIDAINLDTWQKIVLNHKIESNSAIAAIIMDT